MKTLINSKIKFGRLIGTTNLKLAAKIGQIVKIADITRGHDCDVERTEQGTICFWINYDVYEIAEA